MGDEPWNGDAAHEALILLREAHDAWTELLPRALGPGQDKDDLDHILRSLHQRAASTLTWARGLHEMAEAPHGLPGYSSSQAPQAEMLDAALYACARAIHQLIHVGRYNQAGRSYPRTYPVRYLPASIHWVAADKLPPEEADSGPTRTRRRTAYLRRWAEQPMAAGLTEVRTFMDAKIGPAVGL